MFPQPHLKTRTYFSLDRLEHVFEMKVCFETINCMLSTDAIPLNPITHTLSTDFPFLLIFFRSCLDLRQVAAVMQK